MKDFVLIFRSRENPHVHPSPEKLQERMNWMGGIAARNRLADKGHRLSATAAKTVRPGNVVTEGPYAVSGECISGYMIVKAASMEEAVELAKENPIFRDGGNIEVRAVLTPGDNS